MATPTLLIEQTIHTTLECGCPHCGEALVAGLLEVAGGGTVDTVTCPKNCDLRPYTFPEPADE